MAGAPRPGESSKYALPSQFTKNVLYEFDETDFAGSVTHRKVKATGFILIAKDLDTGQTVQIDLDSIGNLKQHTVTL